MLRGEDSVGSPQSSQHNRHNRRRKKTETTGVSQFLLSTKTMQLFIGLGITDLCVFATQIYAQVLKITDIKTY